MVTCWLLIDTIAISASPASRGAAASVERAGRGAASTGSAAVSAVSAAVAASVTMAAGRHRRIASMDCIVMDCIVMDRIVLDRIVLDRFVMPCPAEMPPPRPCQGGSAANKHWTPVDGSCFTARGQLTLHEVPEGWAEVEVGLRPAERYRPACPHICGGFMREGGRQPARNRSRRERPSGSHRSAIEMRG